MQLRHQLLRDLRIERRVVRIALAREIVQEQHRIRSSNLFPRTGDADFLHLVITLAQPRRVNHMHRHAFDLNGLLHLVARGSRNRRDDGQLRTGQRIEQRTLARIGLSGDHHLDPFAQQGPLLSALHHTTQRRLQPLQLTGRIGLLEKVDLFLRKIERRLHQHAQMNERISQAVNLLGERTRKRTPRAARRSLGARINQIGNRLGLRQIDLVVKKRPLGELPRLSQSQPWQGRLRQLKTPRHQQLQHHRPAVRLQLQHILTRVTARPGKEDRQPLINGLPRAIGKRQVMRLTRIERPAQQLLRKRPQRLARHPHDTHGTTSWSGGNGDDGVGMAGEHGQTGL